MAVRSAFPRRWRDPLDYSRKTGLRVFMVLVLTVLYAPIVTLVIFSFNDSKRNVVWRGFTTKYYQKAMENDGLIDAFINSLVIAGVTTVVSTILGGLTGVFLWRFRFAFKPIYEGVLVMPIVVPEICLGVAMLIFFAQIGWPTTLVWPFSLISIIVSHIAFTFPFVAMVVRARMAGFNRELEEASRDLGASEWQTFVNVTLPYLRPGLLAGGLLAFTLSLDDFIVTFFTSGLETVTLPVKIYAMVRFSVTPEVNAASAILIAITLLATLIAIKLQGNHPFQKNMNANG